MKKRILTLLLAVSMAVSLLILPSEAAAAGKFSDVTDNYTASAIESLRMMGVLDGYADGTFRPDGLLTRAQFCKMATYALDRSSSLGRYTTVTIFPDVKPSHWAVSFINLSARNGMIAGYPDGNFYPERTVTAGQAVTILLRALGYEDSEVGGVWPAGFMALAQSSGLTDNTGISGGNSPLTRAQAARLFLNLLRTAGKDGSTLYTLFPEDSTVTVTAVDGGKGTISVYGKEISTYTMAHPTAASALIGVQGQLILNEKGKVMSFLPASMGSTGFSSAAVICYADGATDSLDALAGNTTYSIYKNGAPATAKDICRYDVATYNAATNAIRVCDTRVSVYYEDCSPSPSAPTSIEALGTAFSVLPTAQDTLSKFKPGDVITLLLTADGQVAGAVEGGTRAAGSNAMAAVDGDGSMSLICGNTLIPLSITADEKYFGNLVTISSVKDRLYLSIPTSRNSANLDVAARMLGKIPLSDGVMIFDGAVQTPLASLNSIVSAGQIKYYRTNWKGDVDLVALNSVGNTKFGVAVISYEEEWIWNDDADFSEPEQEGVNGHTKTTQFIEIRVGNDQSYGPFKNASKIKTGDVVAFVVNKDNTNFTRLEKLSAMKNVSPNAWIGSAAVNFGGATYSVPANVLCYNQDNGRWLDSLDAAKAYSPTMTLYVSDGVVRIVAVGG